MRFAARILIGIAAATTVAIAAPAAAGASVTTAPTGTTSASSSYEADWGPYYSADHKAEAEGRVSVEQKKFKHWYWKTFWVKKKVCEHDEHGDKTCEWISKKVKKHVWEWKYTHFYTVHSKLSTDKWWGRNKCAWETFKIVNHDGSSYFKKFKNCHKHPKHYAFSGKDAAHIYVNVSRGNRWTPKGWHSGWQDVYHAAV